MSTARTVWGTGLSTIASDGTVLDAWFPELGFGEQDAEDAAAAAFTWDAFAEPDERRGVTVELVQLSIDLDAPVASTPDAYLRLHALSHLLVNVARAHRFPRRVVGVGPTQAASSARAPGRT